MSVDLPTARVAHDGDRADPTGRDGIPEAFPEPLHLVGATDHGPAALRPATGAARRPVSSHARTSSALPLSSRAGSSVASTTSRTRR